MHSIPNPLAPIPCIPIAQVRSPYRQKFAIPRQPNLVPEAEGEILFAPGYADPNVLRGLEQFSHLWLLFAFHETAAQGWSPMVQPPRLGGRERIGVFASRSTFRPNPLGLSVVEYLGHAQRGARLSLRVRGLDLLDGTPILDIKPYLPWADSVPEARAGYAQEPPPRHAVRFSERARADLAALQADYPGLEALVRAVLAQDPRPAWRRQGEDGKRYGMSLYDLNVKWRVAGEGFEVLWLERLAQPAEAGRGRGP